MGSEEDEIEEGSEGGRGGKSEGSLWEEGGRCRLEKVHVWLYGNCLKCML